MSVSLLAISEPAIRLCVSPLGSGTKTGDSWANAMPAGASYGQFNTVLEAAAELATPELPCQVLVREGTYSGNFRIYSNIHIYGGYTNNSYSNDITIRDNTKTIFTQTNRTPTEEKPNSCIFSSPYAANYIFENFRIDGVTLTNGAGQYIVVGSTTYASAGVVDGINLATGVIRYQKGYELHNCIVKNNGDAGPNSVISGGALFENCIFTDNMGYVIFNNTDKLDNCTVHTNVTDAIMNGVAEVDNSTFYGNTLKLNTFSIPSVIGTTMANSSIFGHNVDFFSTLEYFSFLHDIRLHKCRIYGNVVNHGNLIGGYITGSGVTCCHIFGNGVSTPLLSKAARYVCIISITDGICNNNVITNNTIALDTAKIGYNMNLLGFNLPPNDTKARRPSHNTICHNLSNSTQTQYGAFFRKRAKANNVIIINSLISTNTTTMLADSIADYNIPIHYSIINGDREGAKFYYTLVQDEPLLKFIKATTFIGCPYDMTLAAMGPTGPESATDPQWIELHKANWDVAAGSTARYMVSFVAPKDSAVPTDINDRPRSATTATGAYCVPEEYEVTV